MTVQGKLDSNEIIKRVDSLGYKASHPRSGETDQKDSQDSNFFSFLWKTPNNRLLLASLFLILPGFLLEELLGVSYPFIPFLSITALVLAGYPIFRSAVSAIIISHEININVLMSIAAIGALSIGYLTEASMVMVLFAVGESLEGFTSDKARRSLSGILSSSPKTATLIIEENYRKMEVIVPISELKIGDRIIVKPGERIPMDGNVAAGVSHVNQAPITGESQLIIKKKGDNVFASSTNFDGMLEILISHTVEDNTISRLIKLVEDTQQNRAKAHRFVDKFARVYTPAVVAAAILVAVIPPLLFNQPFLDTPDGQHGWLYRALAMLVVSCPCALVISTPVSIISAISNAASKGIIFKGGASLEELSRVKVMAFDKTGTLTYGNPQVVEIAASGCVQDCLSLRNLQQTDLKPHACEKCLELMSYTAAVEMKSGHPLGDAIVDESKKWFEAGLPYFAESVTSIPGKGVVGIVNQHQVVISSFDHFNQKESLSPEYARRIVENKNNGYTVISIAIDNHFAGFISFADMPRHTIKAAMKSLRKEGIESIVMLTGDHSDTAKQIGEETGITDIRASLLPEDKLDIIRSFQDHKQRVAMVGDGINDTPALSLADVGIAVSGLGENNGHAVEIADVILLNGDLQRIPYAYALSKKTMNTIVANIIFSIGIKLGFVILVLFGASTMWMAVMADMGASLLVTLNGMRLLRYSPNNKDNKD